MNTPQLIVAWLAALVIAAILFISAWLMAPGVGAVASAVLGVAVLAAILIYTFSDHNQANNKRVALFCMGGVLVFGGAAGLAYFGISSNGEHGLPDSQFSEPWTPNFLGDIFGFGSTDHRIPEETTELAEQIFLSDLEAYENYEGRLGVRGLVKNNSDEVVSAFLIGVTITDTLDNVVNVGSGPVRKLLAPGESKRFDMSTGARPLFGDNRVIKVDVYRAQRAVP